MGIERIACASEKHFTEQSVDYIEDCILRYHDSKPGNFVLGFTGSNGRLRRGRVGDLMTNLANRTRLDWRRIFVFLADERFGFQNEEDSNCRLIEDNLIWALRRRKAPFRDEQLVLPNTSLASAEACAEDYHRRLCSMLEREAPSGPHLLCLGLANDQSIAGIFPEWYKNSPERWASAVGKTFGVLATETASFEVAQRITVNLRTIRKTERVLLFLGDGSEQAWRQVKEAFDKSVAADERRVKRARSCEFTGITYAMEDGMLVLNGHAHSKRATGSTQLPANPMVYILKHTNITVLQKKADQENQHSIIVLGAAGDLARKKTFVALLHLHMARCLPCNLSIVACDDPTFHSDIATADDLWDKRLKKHLEGEHEVLPQDLQEFRSRLSFIPARLGDVESWKSLHEHICSKANGAIRDNRMYYLALPSFLFARAVEHIRSDCWSQTGFNRVIVEKPFGRNGEESRQLSSQICKYLQECHIFRIDHYLAKTLVLNILTLRFANRELGSLLHAHHIANVRITFKEDIGVDGRAGYFDSYGIIRDIMQNHLMQVLSLVAMEAPASLHAEDVRDEKVKVLKQIRPIEPEDCVIGQYDGYQDDPGIQKINAAKGYPSRTPTYALVVMYLDNERWSGVPFIMKAGKALENRHTMVRVQFKKSPPHSLFGDQPQNELVIRIQPNEAIYYKILAKMPGLSQKAEDVHQTVLDLDLKKRFELRRLPEAYEKLIHDVLQGESHNFVRGDELEQAWRIFDPLLRKLEVEEERVPERYARGTRGPPTAEALIERMGFRRYTETGVPGFAEEDFG